MQHDAGPLESGDPGRPLLNLVAQAADVCLKPWLHGVRYGSADAVTHIESCDDCVLIVEARDAAGRRCPEQDFELEMYRSGSDLNLMLARVNDETRPVLWHGSHPVWMDGASGERCSRPDDGAPLEALCRRLRAMLNLEVSADC